MERIEEFVEIACLRELTDRQRKFVMILATCPSISRMKAMGLAGYEGSRETKKQRAHEMAHNPKILNAIRIMGGNKLQAAALGAADFLVRAYEDKKLPMTTRIRSAESVLDRIGLGSEQNIKVEHTHTDLTGAAMMERIRELAKKHGLDPEKLLTGQTKLSDVSRETSQEPLLIEGKAEDADVPKEL
jgi:phage terminase small subunit